MIRGEDDGCGTPEKKWPAVSNSYCSLNRIGSGLSVNRYVCVLGDSRMRTIPPNNCTQSRPEADLFHPRHHPPLLHWRFLNHHAFCFTPWCCRVSSKMTLLFPIVSARWDVESMWCGSPITYTVELPAYRTSKGYKWDCFALLVPWCVHAAVQSSFGEMILPFPSLGLKTDFSTGQFLPDESIFFSNISLNGIDPMWPARPHFRRLS